MVDTARGELANKGKPGVGDEEGEDNSSLWMRMDFERTESAVRDAHGRKDGSREEHSQHNGTYNWREHDGQGGSQKRLPSAVTAARASTPYSSSCCPWYLRVIIEEN